MASHRNHTARHMILAGAALMNANEAAVENLPIREASYLRSAMEQWDLAEYAGSEYKDAAGRYALLRFQGRA